MICVADLYLVIISKSLVRTINTYSLCYVGKVAWCSSNSQSCEFNIHAARAWEKLLAYTCHSND
jgi:hypothetical protein